MLHDGYNLFVFPAQLTKKNSLFNSNIKTYHTGRFIEREVQLQKVALENGPFVFLCQTSPTNSCVSLLQNVGQRLLEFYI